MMNICPEKGDHDTVWIKKPGFFLNISPRCQSDRRNPVSGLWERPYRVWIKKPGFFTNISVLMPKLLSKPGFCRGGAPVPAPNPVSGRGPIAGVKKPGFFLNISPRCQSDRRNPVSGLWKRPDTVWIKKPGFFTNISVLMPNLL
jgi:hypothetical protein